MTLLHSFKQQIFVPTAHKGPYHIINKVLVTENLLSFVIPLQTDSASALLVDPKNLFPVAIRKTKKKPTNCGKVALS